MNFRQLYNFTVASNLVSLKYNTTAASVISHDSPALARVSETNSEVVQVQEYSWNALGNGFTISIKCVQAFNVGKHV